MARGQIARHEFSTRFGTTWKGADKIDWGREAALAKAWKDSSIEQRAKVAKLQNYYELPYRQGCSFDHSDSWAAASFLDTEDDGSVALLVTPGPAFVDFALLAGAFALAQIVRTLGNFYEFDFGDAVQEADQILNTAFPTPSRAAGA